MAKLNRAATNLEPLRSLKIEHSLQRPPIHLAHVALF